MKLTPQDADSQHAYKKIDLNYEAVDNLFTDLFIEAEAEPPEQVILDVDAIDDPLDCNQEGKFTAIIRPTAICHCILSATRCCCAPDCELLIMMVRPER